MLQVYVLCDSRKSGFFSYAGYGFDYEPFYVGLTNNLRRRVMEHFNAVGTERGERLRDSVQGNGLVVETVWMGEECKDASREEREAIKGIGRKDMGLGPLLNTHGGGQIISYERLSQAQRLRYRTQKRLHAQKIWDDMWGIRAGLERYWSSMSKEERSERGFRLAEKRRQNGSEDARGKAVSDTKRRIALDSYLDTLKGFDHFWIPNYQKALLVNGGKPCLHFCSIHGKVLDSREAVASRIRRVREPCKFCNAEHFEKDIAEKMEALRRRQRCQSRA